MGLKRERARENFEKLVTFRQNDFVGVCSFHSAPIWRKKKERRDKKQIYKYIRIIQRKEGRKIFGIEDQTIGKKRGQRKKNKHKAFL